jgi:hypothetical protein
MTNNTTYQRILENWNGVVTGNNVVAQGATLQGHNQTGGTFTANGASAVTVGEPNVTSSSVIVITLKTVGGTVGAHPVITTITPGTGFTVTAIAADTSVYNYLVIG